MISRPRSDSQASRVSRLSSIFRSGSVSSILNRRPADRSPRLDYSPRDNLPFSSARSARSARSFRLRLTNVLGLSSGLNSPSSPCSAYSLSQSRRSSFGPDFTEVLSTAKLAEKPTDPSLLHDGEFHHLRTLRGGDEIGDGLWLCCNCQHENILRHYEGPYPFKYLRCAGCNRNICSACQTSEILTQWPHCLIYGRAPAPDQEVRYCQVCKNCGLTHRAEMEGTILDFHTIMCPDCGATSFGSDWLRYCIGDVEPYRMNPDGKFAYFLEVRASRAEIVKLQRDTEEVLRLIEDEQGVLQSQEDIEDEEEEYGDDGYESESGDECEFGSEGEYKSDIEQEEQQELPCLMRSDCRVSVD